MADLTVTAANVSAGTNSKQDKARTLEAVAAGDLLYRRASDKKVGLCDNNSATAEIRKAFGIALNSAGAGQNVVVHRSGRINIGAVVAVGTAYFSSATPGKIAVAADNTSGKYPTFVGFAVATTTIEVNFVEAGVAVP